MKGTVNSFMKIMKFNKHCSSNRCTFQILASNLQANTKKEPFFTQISWICFHSSDGRMWLTWVAEACGGTADNQVYFTGFCSNYVALLIVHEACLKAGFIPASLAPAVLNPCWCHAHPVLRHTWLAPWLTSVTQVLDSAVLQN